MALGRKKRGDGWRQVGLEVVKRRNRLRKMTAGSGGIFLPQHILQQLAAEALPPSVKAYNKRLRQLLKTANL
jgi:hypothetical protein